MNTYEHRKPNSRQQATEVDVRNMSQTQHWEAAMLRAWKGIEAPGWRGLRIAWAVSKIGIMKSMHESMFHAPVNVTNGRGREKMRKF